MQQELSRVEGLQCEQSSKPEYCKTQGRTSLDTRNSWKSHAVDVNTLPSLRAVFGIFCPEPELGKGLHKMQENKTYS